MKILFVSALNIVVLSYFTSCQPVQPSTPTKSISTSINQEKKPMSNLSEVLSNLQANFNKPSNDELKKTLTPLEFKVTQHEGTERAFSHPLADNKEKGIYVDIVSGIPLFSSATKFDSGTGWPSFFAPIHDEEIILKEDRKLFGVRTEVRSKTADTHLGHVFNDAPQTPTGKRYCINGASLKFVAVQDFEEEGLEAYTTLFTTP